MINQATEDTLTEVLQISDEPARRAACGDYWYRGESECYEHVSSSLYREYSDIEAEYFEVTVVQEEMLQAGQHGSREPDEDVIEEQLQHVEVLLAGK